MCALAGLDMAHAMRRLLARPAVMKNPFCTTPKVLGQLFGKPCWHRCHRRLRKFCCNNKDVGKAATFSGLFHVRAHFNWTALYKRCRLSTLGLCALRESPMVSFIHNEYLIHLRNQLARTIEEAKLRQTSTLLAEEEVKDHLPPEEN